MNNDRLISSSAIYGFIEACEANEKINLINFALIQNDDLLAQFCKRPYKEDSMQLLFSMTKSITSLAIGIAIDKGILCLHDDVASIFQEELPQNPHPHLFKMQIQHLLTMTAGIHDNTYPELFPKSNWVKAFLEQDFPHEPGTYYRYSTHATHMLSAIIEKVTGASLENFLKDNLFSLMDITQVQWECSPGGLTAGGMGLSLSPPSLIKLAKLLLHRGVYNGRRVISEEYIALATSPQVIKQDDQNNPDKYFSGYQYGFQFHISPNNTYRADGAFGQFCVIHPAGNFAVIATSQSTKVESFLALIDKYFIQQREEAGSISSLQLDAYLSDLAFTVPNQEGVTCSISPCIYDLFDNELNITAIGLAENMLSFTFSDGRQDDIDLDLNGPVYGKSHFIKDLQVHLQEHCVFAGWDDEGSLLLTVYYIETPYIGEYKLQFVDEKVVFTFHINVSMTLKGFTVTGRRRSCRNS